MLLDVLRERINNRQTGWLRKIFLVLDVKITVQHDGLNGL